MAVPAPSAASPDPGRVLAPLFDVKTKVRSDKWRSRTYIVRRSGEGPMQALDILLEAQRWASAGRRAAIATVVETWGSAPRPVGSHLVVDETGNFLGSVSGGCVEGEVIAEAQEAILAGEGRLLEFGVADATAWRAGLSCGGRIKVYVRPLDPSLLAAIIAERANRRPCAIVINLRSGTERFIRPSDLAADPLAAKLEQRLQQRESGVEESDGELAFVIIYAPPIRLIAIGAVHISQSLAPMAQLAGFETIIIDPRTAFATADRFPGARLVTEWPQDALAALGLDPATAVVLLTHEPRIDDEALSAALNANCFYIGALGSPKTHARRVERMHAAGFSTAALDRIHAPVGLAIGAKSPAEIAVAILGEIIGAMHQSPSSKSERAA
jgi:xanthine dehydrogenase accessory factor